MTSILSTLLYLLTLLTPAAAAAAPATPPDQASRPLAGFHAIVIEDGIDLFLRQGPAAVAVKADTADDRVHIRTTVEDRVLRVHCESPGWGA